MDTNKMILIMGLILLLFFILHNVNVNKVIPVTTSQTTPIATKTTTVIYKNPVVPHYNAYKAQYYN